MIDEVSVYESIPVHARYIAKSVKRNLAKLEAEPVGVSTGFTTLDETGVRLLDSELFVVAARPGMGKTSFALQMAMNAARHLTEQGKTVLIYSCEMTQEAVLLRMASSLAGVNIQAIKLRKAPEGDEEKLYQALDEISRYEIVINDSTSPDTSKIAAEVSDMRESGKPVGLLVVDYLELLGDSTYAPSETEKIGKIIKRLKAIAKKFLIPVILVSQVSREVDASATKLPLVSQMSGSRWVEATADKLITMMRPEYYLSQGTTAACELSTDADGVVYVSVLKNRDGVDKFTLRMGWNGRTTSVYDLHPSMKRIVRDLSPKKGEAL